LVGPVFQCLIAKQFLNYKNGDRFYYENGPNATSFSIDQLVQIKQRSLAKIICDNTGAVNIQPKAFLQGSAEIGNAHVACDSLPKLDLTQWN
jgi:peroxidase